jgi:hypothetical protein
VEPAGTVPRQRDAVGIALVVYAVFQLALGLVMVFAAGWFFDNVGPFGTQNDHYTRDNATMSLAFGVAGLVAVRRRSWRVPVLAVWTLQAAFHSVNHLYDIGRADPERYGPMDFVLIALSAVLLGWVTWQAARAERET